jgi:hypothetical protein
MNAVRLVFVTTGTSILFFTTHHGIPFKSLAAMYALVSSSLSCMCVRVSVMSVKLTWAEIAQR